MRRRIGDKWSVRLAIYNQQRRECDVVWFDLPKTGAWKVFRRLVHEGPQPKPKRPKHKRKVFT